MSEAFILDAIRSPIGRYGGALSGVRPDDLAAHVVRSLVDRAPELDPARLDDVYFGAANAAGEDNRDVARMAVLLAQLPVSVPGVTLNRLCGSGMEALIAANRAVAVGDASLAIAGGVESMSRAPWVLLKPTKGFPAGHETLHSTTLGWRMVNQEMPPDWTVSLGEATELLADRYGIGRDTQDGYAVASHQKRGRRVGRRGVCRRGRLPPRIDDPARRIHPSRHDDRSTRETQAGVLHGRHGDCRQLVAR